MPAEANSAYTHSGQGRKALFNEDAERGVLGAILLDAHKVFDFCVEKQITYESF